MSEDDIITIDAAPAPKKVPTITVRLVGIEYQVAIPKAGSAIAMARPRDKSESVEERGRKAVTGLFKWIDAAFGDAAEEVSERLEDPNDLLDFQHIQELQMALLEVEAKKSGNPPTSSSASRASRRTTGRTSRATR